MFYFISLIVTWKAVSLGYIYSTNFYKEHIVCWVLYCIPSRYGVLRKCWLVDEWVNEQMNNPLTAVIAEACLSLHFSSFQIWVLPTPAQGCRAPGFSPSPISQLGFQPRRSDKEAVIRTHPLCITIVRGYKGCSKRMHLTCIWKVSSPFTPIKDLFLFCPV